MKGSTSLQKQFMDWEKVKSAAILVSSSHYSAVKDFAKQTDKSIDVIVVHPDKLSVTKDCFLSLNKKDFNFFGLPNQAAVKKIGQKSFDVLIDYDFENSGFLKALTGLTPAKCKLGPENASYSDLFDISIQSMQPDFLKQALKYLMMIKS